MIIRFIITALILLSNCITATAQDEISIATLPNFPFRPKVSNPSPIGFFGDRVLSLSGSVDFTHFKANAALGYRAGITGGIVDYTYHSIVTGSDGFRIDMSDLPENFSYLGLSIAGVFRKKVSDNLQLEISAGIEKRQYKYGNERDTTGYTFTSGASSSVRYLVTSNRINDQLNVNIPATISMRQILSKRSALTTGLALSFGLSPIRKGEVYVSHEGKEYNGSYNIRSSIVGFDLRYSYNIGQTMNVISRGQSDPSLHKKAIFLELLGSGRLYSLNYDVRLKSNSNQGFGLRIGIGRGGYASIETFGDRYITLPLNFNYIAGKKRSGLEAGISLTPEFTYQDFDDKLNFFSLLNLGYRYQPVNKGFLFRLAYTPVLIGEESDAPIGISVGYGFR